MSPFGSFSLILYFRSIFIFFALISSSALSAEGVRFAYVANPYDYTISEFYVDENGVMFPNGMVYTKDKYPSTLIIHPTGKFIYSASRTVDTAPIYQIDPVTGWLSQNRILIRDCVHHSRMGFIPMVNFCMLLVVVEESRGLQWMKKPVL